jgi:hypothetical protein
LAERQDVYRLPGDGSYLIPHLRLQGALAEDTRYLPQ